MKWLDIACYPPFMCVNTAELSAPPRHNLSSTLMFTMTCQCRLTSVDPLYCRDLWVYVNHGGGHVCDLWFLKVSWNVFCVYDVVVIKKDDHEAVELKNEFTISLTMNDDFNLNTHNAYRYQYLFSMFCGYFFKKLLKSFIHMHLQQEYSFIVKNLS